MTCDFSYEHYDYLMKQIFKSFYKPIFYNEVEKKYIRKIIIRHDVDLDLDSALEIAKIEKLNKAKATYFIWMNSPFYNIFEKRYKDIIMEILSLGHNIGVHFDQTVYNCRTKEDIERYLDKEMKILSDYFNTNVNSVSFHRPSNYILNSNLKFDNIINAYSNEYFRNFKYISDSRGIWREGCLCKLIKDDSFNNIHVLTHPEWWGKHHLDNQERIYEFLNKKLIKSELDLKNNISIYKMKNYTLSKME